MTMGEDGEKIHKKYDKNKSEVTDFSENDKNKSREWTGKSEFAKREFIKRHLLNKDENSRKRAKLRCCWKKQWMNGLLKLIRRNSTNKPMIFTKLSKVVKILLSKILHNNTKKKYVIIYVKRLNFFIITQVRVELLKNLNNVNAYIKHD